MLLQEIDRFKGSTGNIDQAAYFAEALGMNHAFGANVTSGNGEYGVAILSRFKILGSQNYLLPNGPGGEQRGLLGVGVEIGGQEVRIYNTHLQNKLPGLREAQARHVAGILANEENPIILGGDMNATISTPTLAPLTAQLVDAWTVGSGPEGTGPNGSRIDFLLASPTIMPQRATRARSAISDHSRLLRRLRGAGLDGLPQAETVTARRSRALTVVAQRRSRSAARGHWVAPSPPRRLALRWRCDGYEVSGPTAGSSSCWAAG